MALSPMQQFLAQTHALTELNHLILRIVVKRAAQDSGNAEGYIAELVETLEVFFDKLEQTVPNPGEFGRVQREEERRRLKIFELNMAGDLGLATDMDDVAPG